MICLKKIIHRPQIYLGFCALLLSVFLSFGLYSDSHATSDTCTWSFEKTSTSTNSINTRIQTVCPNIPRGAWVRVYSYEINFSVYGGKSYVIGLSSGTDNPMTFISERSSGSQIISANLPEVLYVPNTKNVISGLSNFYIYLYGSSMNTSKLDLYTGSITFQYTDNLADFGAEVEPCPEVVPCPPIPENPYDDKLDAIKTAIYACGASLFVIYFFVCIYKIIVKDGGSRK